MQEFRLISAYSSESNSVPTKQDENVYHPKHNPVHLSTWNNKKNQDRHLQKAFLALRMNQEQNAT